MQSPPVKYNIDKALLDQYSPADKFLTVNNRDPDLQPIDIPLPHCPRLDLIDGFGLPAKEQKYRRHIMPAAIQAIVRSCETTDQVWTKIWAKKDDLKEELDYIKRMWYHRCHGYWVFICGKPTYLTGSHFFYLEFFKIDVGAPDYRDRSRKHFIVLDWLHEYRYDFVKKEYDVHGVRLPNKYGDELEDTGGRTMFGLALPKMRRAGTSYESLAWMLNRITMAINAHSGIQGPKKEHGRRAFNKLVAAWRKLPFFFQPLYEGDNNPETQLSFIHKTTGDINAELGLESKVTFATTSDGLHYDQEKLLDYLREEPGKTLLSDIYLSWDKIKETLAQGEGSNIVGFAMFPSTVGEMEGEGGENYYYLCRDSDYYQRISSGQTKTGLVLIFIPGDEGLEGHIDEYGNSIIFEPTPDQVKAGYKKHGARHHILSQREHYLHMGTPEAIAKYQELKRLYPLTIKECFSSMAGNAGFNEIILDARISDLRFNRTATRRGNFKWEGGKMWVNGRLARVVWEDDPEKGRWAVSELPPEEMTNRYFIRDGVYFPAFPKSHMHCSDPFNFDETEHGRQSMGGGICIKRKKKGDKEIDVKKMRYPRITCHYSYRQLDTEKFCEDMLMQTLFYGGKHNPESNNEMVRKFFKKNKCRGFLYYYKEEDGKPRKTAGYNLTGEMGTKILGTAVDFIENHGHDCDHYEVLVQCKELRGRRDITNKDLVAVLGGATHAISEDYRGEEMDDDFDNKEGWGLDDWIKKA